jgi:murein DD-endopeptidase MepM/ murein hydrolase activator NlpD
MRSSQLLLVPALIASVGAVHAAKTPQGVHKVKQGKAAAKTARAHGKRVSRVATLNSKVKLSRGASLKASNSARPASERLELIDPVASETPQTATLEAGKESLAPVPALPSIPSAAPSTLIHLERVLPNQLEKTLSSTLPESSTPLLSAQPTSSALPLLHSVFLPSSGLEYESVVASNLGFEPADPNHLDLLWPVETRTVSSAWGPRIRTRTMRVVKASVRKRVRVRYHGSHKGVDLTAPIGTNVYSALDGRVVLTGTHRQYGNFVLIDHGNGVQTMYAHHRVNLAHTGDIVRRGQKIAEVGRTGNATGPHLHFELRLQGQAHNPLPYLNDVEEISSELVAFNNIASPSTTKH